MAEKRMPGYWRKEKLAQEAATAWNRRGDGRYVVRTGVVVTYRNYTHRRLKSFLIFRVA